MRRKEERRKQGHTNMCRIFFANEQNRPTKVLVVGATPQDSVDDITDGLDGGSRQPLIVQAKQEQRC